MRTHDVTSRRLGIDGQVLAIMAIGLTGMLLMSALVIDGGNAWAQQRGNQNASDSASLAGSSVLLRNMAGDAQTNAAVLAAVQASFASNNTTFVSANYVDFARNDLGAIPNDGAPVLTGPGAPVGVFARGTRTFGTYLAQLAGVTTLGTSAEATSIAGTADGVCSANSGCAVLPVTFSINTTDCAGNGNIEIGKDLWPTVDLDDARADMGIGDLEAIYPLYKVGPGGVGWLDFGCGGTLSQQITTPCNKAFDIPTWIQTSNGNPNNVESEMNTHAGKVVLIPLFDATCRDIPVSGLTADCTDPGNGDNRYYHITKFVSMLLHRAYIQGDNSIACNSAPGIVVDTGGVGGNGGTSCLKGWFVEYVIEGPVGEFDPDDDNAVTLAIQLIK